MGWKITDKFLVDPQDNDSVPFDQGGIVRRSTWGKIKDYILGNASLVTNDKTVRGAINEVNTSLSEKANPNLLINGAPSVWQRGTSFNNVQQYTADRWFYICYTSSPQGSLTKDVDNSIKITNFNTNQNFIEQIIETNLSEKLAGRKVTLSAEIKVTGMTQGSLFLQLLSSLGTDSINYTGAVMNNMVISQSDVSSDYKKFSLTITLPTTLKTLVPQIGSVAQIGNGMVNNNCVVNIKNIKLELGEKATLFVPSLPSQELSDCQRYYEKTSGYTITKMASSPYVFYEIHQNFLVTKRTTPTISIYSSLDNTKGYLYDDGVGNSAVVPVKGSQFGFSIQHSNANLIVGHSYLGYYEADAEIY
ncbi:hypothetical protein [Clostridium beijerinckii]|uniref:hypothetical protein n=1 Tax=Clostridium beijerinckii TaxID=1520 RepID=UPI001F2F7F9E|nr:hypothetical protein [Clostridium beijerinckii]